ncbi:MAG: hypothetical protein ACRDRQ_01275 [Pseudonocardiaceae bacterium]
MSAPLPLWCADSCVVCPARKLGPGQFDVLDRPARDYRLNRVIGWRVDPAGNAVCVHPYRVGLPVGRYASLDVPLPDPSTLRPEPTAAALELPEDVTDLEGWFVAVLRVAGPADLFGAVGRAEELAGQRFAPEVVTTALRQVLSYELAHRD